jgi:hypothetical protein
MCSFMRRRLITTLLLSFAGRANLAARSGFSGLSVGTVYTEKEQSTDSTATDVEKDFIGRVGE